MGIRLSHRGGRSARALLQSPAPGPAPGKAGCGEGEGVLSTTVNEQSTRYLDVLYVTSLYVRCRGHTSARQARQHGQEKHPRRPAWLDEAHRGSARFRTLYGVSTRTIAIAPAVSSSCWCVSYISASGECGAVSCTVWAIKHGMFAPTLRGGSASPAPLVAQPPPAPTALPRAVNRAPRAPELPTALLRAKLTLGRHEDGHAVARCDRKHVGRNRWRPLEAHLGVEPINLAGRDLAIRLCAFMAARVVGESAHVDGADAWWANHVHACGRGIHPHPSWSRCGHPREAHTRPRRHQLRADRGHNREGGTS